MRPLPPRVPAPARFTVPALLAALTATAASLHAQSPSLVTTADRIFAAWNTTHTPGCAVGVARGGVTLLERGYGMADLAGERPITPATILESGSVAKQFTAAAVMLLVADGKLALEDDARKYLPELPLYGKPITVRNLLTHTSGLREWSNLMAWQGWPRGTRVHTQPYVYSVITAQKALNYPVGEHYSYTNSGFLLLRTLVERVSGQTFSEFSKARIFTPLGLTHTQWRDDFTRIVPGLAQAYARDGAGFSIDMPTDNIIAAGGLLTTVGDWLRWNNALTKKTLGAGVVDSLTRQMRLNNGLEIAYALGLTVGQYRGTREVAHSGSTAGYSTYLARFPELGDLSIAVLCNVAGANPTGFTRQLVDALHPELPRGAAPDTVTTDQNALRAWRGLYEDGRWHAVTVLDTAGGMLRQGNNAIRALRDGTWMMGNQRIRLAMDKDGRTRTIRTVTSDGDSVVYTWRTETSAKPTPTELAAYAGRYRSDEIGTTFTVAVENGALTVSPRAGLSDTLSPTFRDAFDGSSNAVWFTRDAKGRVTAMHFGAARVWDFVSTRIP
ncbi:MAG TPA: serine hydrolase [Gemmatimonas sp.]|uniref:serine hydrolase n=1 Tax=Gemmatimonas sp. TaxID=1962908 RepID=UPI002EDADC75